MTTLAPGALFAGHQVVRLIGSGTFGHVYEARRLPVGRRVALKVLHHHLAAHAEALARFQREGEIVAQVEHPHVVTVMDLGLFEGQPYIVMPLLEGETLARRLARAGALPLDEALGLFLPLLSAVDAVHARHVVHRDLKPENVFLDRGVAGQVVPRLLDFGIAKLEEGSVALTRASAMMGTPFYMPPEQVQGALHADARSDLWSLGVIFFEMVAGRRPFTGATTAEVFVAIGRGPTPSIRATSPSLPADLDAVVGRALEKLPGRRWQSGRDFALALFPFATPATRAYWEAAFREPLDRTLIDDAPPSVPPAPVGVLEWTSYSEPTPPPLQDLAATQIGGPQLPTAPVPRSSGPPGPGATQFMPQGVAGTIMAERPPGSAPDGPSHTQFMPQGVTGTLLSGGGVRASAPSIPGTPSWPSAAVPARARKGPRRAWLVMAGLVVVGVVVALVVAQWGDDEPLPPPAPVTIPTSAPAQ